MPWEHCGRRNLDNLPCPECGHVKAVRTIHVDKTKLFVIGAPPWKGDSEAQVRALQAAYAHGVPLCET